MENCASSATTRRSQLKGQLEAGADGVALHGGDGDEPRVAQPGEALLVVVDRRATARRRTASSSPATDSSPSRAASGRASRRSSPAEKLCPRPARPRPGRRRAVSAPIAAAPATSWASARCAPRAGRGSPWRSSRSRRPAARPRRGLRESWGEPGGRHGCAAARFGPSCNFWRPHAAVANRGSGARRSGQRHQVGVVLVPEVLDAVGQDQHPVGLERHAPRPRRG